MSVNERQALDPAFILPEAIPGFNEEGEYKKALVGILRADGRNGLLILDRAQPAIGKSLFIHEKDLNGAPFDMKVVAELIGIADQPYGRILEVLGDPGRADVAIQSIIRSYRLPEAFPEEVLKEIEQIPSDPGEEAVAEEIARGRRDLRNLRTITIDGLDARDLDDAIDLEKKEDGYFLWVHIADVAHYLQAGSAMNKEALQRGNSVYLVDRVLPMLPPKLSNGLCSLNPGRDRLALSCGIEYDMEGNVRGGEIVESVIRSKVRSSYEELNEMFSGGRSSEDRPEWFAEEIDHMRELNAILSHKRRKRGALLFEFPETVVKLDADGTPVDIYGSRQEESNQIIESFMIAANEFVAAYCDKHALPAIYRVHEEPDPDKLGDIAGLLRERDMKIRLSPKPAPLELRQILESLKGQPFGPAFANLILRSLAKARYDTKDIGHYGLASKQYLHFTAPIRRYADVCVHRAIKARLHRQKLSGNIRGLETIAGHVSLTERVAEDAERDTEAQKIVEYYAQRLGEEYDGKISGMSQNSLYIELPSTAEGAILYAHMGQGYVRFDPGRMMAENMNTHELFLIGDPVRVRIAAADTERRYLDLELLSHEAVSRSVKGRVRESVDYREKSRGKKKSAKKHALIRPAAQPKKKKAKKRR